MVPPPQAPAPPFQTRRGALWGRQAQRGSFSPLPAGDKKGGFGFPQCRAMGKARLCWEERLVTCHGHRRRTSSSGSSIFCLIEIISGSAGKARKKTFYMEQQIPGSATKPHTFAANKPTNMSRVRPVREEGGSPGRRGSWKAAVGPADTGQRPRPRPSRLFINWMTSGTAATLCLSFPTCNSRAHNSCLIFLNKHW